MKASEIRELSPDEIQQKLTDLKHELFNLRFQHETGQLENPCKLKQTKKDIARIYTVISEKANNSEETDN
ncbi:MAG: 50S ribosomal protein L29 [Desulfosarcinaceae bacterium]